MTTTHLPVAHRLPAPVIDNWDWQAAAACRGTDGDAFFHPPHERARGRRNRIRAAKVVCDGCPVIQQCLNHALETREPYGVWGGRSENERAAMLGLRSLRYPAPAKQPVTAPLTERPRRPVRTEPDT